MDGDEEAGAGLARPVTWDVGREDGRWCAVTPLMDIPLKVSTSVGDMLMLGVG